PRRSRRPATPPSHAAISAKRARASRQSSSSTTASARASSSKQRSRNSRGNRSVCAERDLRRQPHLPQRDTAEKAVGLGQGFDDLEMVEALAHDELGARLDLLLQDRREIARLAHELGALLVAMRERDR